MYTEKTIATYNTKHSKGLHRAGIDRLVLVNNWDGYDRLFVVKNLYNITPTTTIEEALNNGNFSEIGSTSPVANAIQTTERYIITALDISNGYITLNHEPSAIHHISLYWNGVFMDNDSNGDYTISLNRVNFNLNMVPLIQLDDKVIIQYSF